MRMTGIGLIAAAMLAGSMGIAVAQTSTTTPSPSAASPGAVKCWDSVTKQVRNETPSTSNGSSPSEARAAPTRRRVIQHQARRNLRKPLACRTAVINQQTG